MANYTVTYSDTNKGSIIVSTATADNTTSLTLIGRNYPNFGQPLAENFLHLLENFASPLPPSNPIEGQLWYDTSDPTSKRLKINDGAAAGYAWYPAVGVHQQSVEPTNIKLGDIWVDTEAQLLKIWNGTSWTLIGPSFSSSNRTGSYPDSLLDKNGDAHDVIIMYLNDVVVEIIAKETFQPLISIAGFTTLAPGVNISEQILDGTTPKSNGIATQALNLRQTSPSIEVVSANNFIRNDIDQSTNGTITINNNSGMRIGQTTATFQLLKNSYEAVILNSYDSGRFVFKLDKDNVRTSLVTFDGNTNRVGIGANNTNPQVELDVIGGARFTKKVTITANDTNSFEVTGGIKIGGILSTATVTINSTTSISGQLNSNSIIPQSDSIYNLGSLDLQYQRVYAKYVGTTGTFFSGNLSGSATKLAAQTSFVITGPVETIVPVTYDGNTGGFTKTFNTRFTNDALLAQASTSSVLTTDIILVYSGVENALRKISKGEFLTDVYNSLIPVGSVIPYAANPSGPPPDGYVWCDGYAYNRYGPTYSALYNIIGTRYGTTSGNNFKVPNLNNVLYANTATGATTWPLGINYIIKL
jgi:hypothetical protein